MVKNPTVANIQLMNMSIKPTRTIVSIAPHHSKVPAVVNDASPDFSARVLNVFLKCLVASK